MATDLKQTDDKEDYKASKTKVYSLTFKENRSFELHIHNSVYMFAPYGTLNVDDYVITHPDFLQQQDLFIVKEVI